jgi:hypothetical protein
VLRQFSRRGDLRIQTEVVMFQDRVAIKKMMAFIPTH